MCGGNEVAVVVGVDGGVLLDVFVMSCNGVFVCDAFGNSGGESTSAFFCCTSGGRNEWVD